MEHITLTALLSVGLGLFILAIRSLINEPIQYGEDQTTN